jgi:NTP pyrophosphatase (non-canonical NTP hydrolase)
MTNYQKEVSDNIKKRGYYEGHEPVPLLARHIAKMTEELSELGDAVLMANDKCESVESFEDALMNVLDCARYAFDYGDWSNAELVSSIDDPGDVLSLETELADVVVVALSMAEIIRQNFDSDFDVLQWALQKSQADIARGIRK